MSYAGLTSDPKRRCRPEEHEWAFNGTCYRCDVQRKYLVQEAQRILELDAKGTLGKKAW